MSKKCQAFTAEMPGIGRLLISPCFVIDPSNDNNNKQYNALWDTGASNTVITSKVAKDLGLLPTGKVRTNHANGTSIVNTYLIKIALPNGVGIRGVRVTEGVLTGNFEVLIGMDIITLGDFAISNYNGKTNFTFRVPSKKNIDFVAEENKSKPKWLQSSRGGYKSGKKKR